MKNKILLLCFFAAIFSPSGIDLYIALIPTISELYNVNSEFALSSYILGMAIGTVFSGFLYDKYGGIRLLKWASMLLLITCVFIARTNDFNTLLFLRLIQGIVISPFMLSALSIIKDNMEEQQVGPIYGKINGFMNLIPMFFPSLSILILNHSQQWQTVFVFFAAIAFSFFSFTSLAFREKQIKWNVESNAPINKILNDQHYRKFSAFPILSLSLIFMYCSFSPTVITDLLNWDILSYSFYFGFNGILMFISGQFLGSLFFKYGSKTVLKLGFILALLSSLLLIFSFISAYFVLIGLSFYTISFIFIISSSHALSLSTLKSGIGKANGIISCLQMLLGAILSALTGLLSNGEIIFFFSLAIILMALCGIKIIRGK